MMDARTFDDALQQCLEGMASEATQKAVVEAADQIPEFRTALLDEAAFDALLRAQGFSRKAFVSKIMDRMTCQKGTERFTREVTGKIRRQRSASRTLRWIAPLAVAASLLLVFGIAFWRPSVATYPAAIATVAALEGDVKAVVERQGVRKPVGPGDAILAGDSVIAQGQGGIALTDRKRGLRLHVGPQGQLTLNSPIRFHLVQGRLEAQLNRPQPESERLSISSRLAETRFVGTRLILASEPTNTRIRVEEGEVLFTATDRDESVSVRAGEYAMAHLDFGEIQTGRYAKGMTLQGRMLFQDNFETGIGQWKTALVDEEGHIAPYPPDAPPFAAWKQIERDGMMTGCMEIKGAPERPEGQPSLLPRFFEMPEHAGFILEIDLLYMEEDTSFSVMSYYYGGYASLHEDHRAGNMKVSQSLLQRRWITQRVLHILLNRSDVPHTHGNEFVIDGTLTARRMFVQTKRPLLALKAKKGTVLVDNVRVRELLTFE